jgi:creatinine amidohydrolase/Fe(II)-dependent formamide hydrolase-like protein
VDTGAVAPEHCTAFDSEQVTLVVQAGGGAVYLPPDPPSEAPHGVYGWAPAGSAEKGERVVQAAAERLAAFVRAFRLA